MLAFSRLTCAKVCDWGCNWLPSPRTPLRTRGCARCLHAFQFMPQNRFWSHTLNYSDNLNQLQTELMLMLFLLNILLVFNLSTLFCACQTLCYMLCLPLFVFYISASSRLSPPNSRHHSNIQSIHVQILVCNMTTIIILLWYCIIFSRSSNNIIIESGSRSSSGFISSSVYLK